MRSAGGRLTVNCTAAAITLLAGAFGSVAAQDGRVQSIDPALTRQVDALVAAAMKGQRIPALSVAVLRANELIVAKGYGLADVERRHAADADTVYPIGSISKQFTAAGILFLAERGRLALSDPAAMHLPAARRHAQRISLEQLLRHASGLREFLTLPGFAALDADASARVDDLLALVDREPLGFAPAARWSYSNTGYQWLARIIEHLNGEPYEQFLTEVLFKHAGLPSLHHCGSAAPAGTVARGYTWRKGRWTPVPDDNMNLARGDGGLCGNAVDLARWARALARTDVLAPQSYARMTEPTVLADGSQAPYGMGLALLPLDGKRARVAHNGAIGGFTATLAYYPDDDLAIAILTNRAGAFPEAIEKALARRLLELPAPRIVEAPLPAPLAAALTGRWEIGVAGFPVSIERRANRLWIDMPPPGVASALRYLGGGRLVAAVAPDAVAIQVPEGTELAEPAARIDRLIITMANMAWFAHRGDAGSLAEPEPAPPAVPMPPSAAGAVAPASDSLPTPAPPAQAAPRRLPGQRP